MKNILVIDDDVDILETIVSVLVNYNVTSASTLKEAEEALGKMSYDAVIIDVGLPDGNSLKSLADRDIVVNQPLIFLTGDDSLATEAIAFELGAVDFITKPFNPIDLLIRLEARLEAVK